MESVVNDLPSRGVARVAERTRVGAEARRSDVRSRVVPSCPVGVGRWPRAVTDTPFQCQPPSRYSHKEARDGTLPRCGDRSL